MLCKLPAVFANAYIHSMLNETLFTKHPYRERLKITCKNGYTTKYDNNGITLTCSSDGKWMLLADSGNSGNFVSQADLNDICTAGEISL